MEIADTYRHKHQELVRGEADSGLMRMVVDIATTLFATLAQGGVVLSDPIFDTILATYMRYSRIAIEQYSAVAHMNGLVYDRHEEIEAVETFAEALGVAKESYRQDPTGVPMMSSWVRIRAAMHDFPNALAAAVEERLAKRPRKRRGPRNRRTGLPTHGDSGLREKRIEPPPR